MTTPSTELAECIHRFERQGMTVQVYPGTGQTSVAIHVPWNLLVPDNLRPVDYDAFVLAVAERALEVAGVNVPPEWVQRIWMWPVVTATVEWTVSWRRPPRTWQR